RIREALDVSPDLAELLVAQDLRRKRWHLIRARGADIRGKRDLGHLHRDELRARAVLPRIAVTGVALIVVVKLLARRSLLVSGTVTGIGRPLLRKYEGRQRCG